MKILLNTTENWKEIKAAKKIVENFLKDFDVQITLNKIDLDVSNKNLYETTYSWDWFKRTATRSISSGVIYAIGDLKKGNKEYDVYGLICDKDKADEDENLLAQRSTYNNKKTIEVYAKVVRKKYWGFDYISYNLIHEILHILSTEDTLHAYLKENKNLDDYLTYLKPKKEVVKDLLPLVKRKSEELIRIAKAINMDLRITSGFRSFEEQDALYAQGRTTPGNIVTNARGGQSFHNHRVSFDIVDRKKGYKLTNKDWSILGSIWDYITDGKGEWGGNWKSFVDKPHFQITLGYSLKDFQEGKVDYNKYK
jgi:peptidoglycan L-alanyl-D-glutamate endopeptidase CwlK